MRDFANVTAGTSMDPSDIYNDLGAEEGGGGGPVNPRTQPIHCFGSASSGSVAAAASGSATATPSGMIIRPDSIELFDAQAALLLITTITIGGLPIMHGGNLPGDMFQSRSTYKLRPALAASNNNPMVVSFVNQHTAAQTVYFGCKGPVIRS